MQPGLEFSMKGDKVNCEGLTGQRPEPVLQFMNAVRSCWYSEDLSMEIGSIGHEHYNIYPVIMDVRNKSTIGLTTHRPTILYSITLNGSLSSTPAKGKSFLLLAGMHSAHFISPGTMQLNAVPGLCHTILILPPPASVAELKQYTPAWYSHENMEAPSQASPGSFRIGTGILRTIKLMAAINTVTPGGHLEMQGEIFKLLAIYARQLSSQDQGMPGETSRDRANNARIYILDNLASENPDSTRQLAKRFYLTAQTLNREFISMTGMSVSAFRSHERMEWGKRLLESDGLNAVDTAYRLGFTHPNNFIRAFKKKYGYTPKSKRPKP